MSSVISYKKCPKCDTKNSSKLPICSNCGASIATLSPEQEVLEVDVRSPVLSEDNIHEKKVSNATERAVDSYQAYLECISNPSLKFAIKEGQTIGAEKEGIRADIDVSCVPESEYISRIHAKFVKRDDQWYIQNLSKTNWTKINEEKCEAGEEFMAPVNDGDEISLTYTTFIFRVGD